MNKISIIILNWQNWQDTLACLDSLRQLQSTVPFSIVVCDNASQDDSVAQILHWGQQHFSQHHRFIDAIQNEPNLSNNPSKIHATFTLIQTGNNLGFAGGNNVGIRYALSDASCEYLWILNNDTIVDQYALQRLYDCAQQHPDIALFGSTIVDFYQPDTVQCAGGCRYSPWLTRFQNVLGGKSLHFVKQQPEDIQFDYVYGASMFLRVTTVKHIGLLNEEYFLFYEELDYTRRLKKAGQHIGWCKLSVVYHKCSATIGQARQRDRAKLQRANYYENLSTLKYTRNFHFPLLFWVFPFRFFVKSILLITRRQFFLFPSLLAAYRDFLRR